MLKYDFDFMSNKYTNSFLHSLQFVVPSMALNVIDRAIQSFGAEGVSQDTELAMRWANLRTLRIADVRNFTSFLGI